MARMILIVDVVAESFADGGTDGGGGSSPSRNVILYSWRKFGFTLDFRSICIYGPFSVDSAGQVGTPEADGCLEHSIIINYYFNILLIHIWDMCPCRGQRVHLPSPWNDII